MNTIIGDLGKSQKFVDLIKQIENKTSPILISGLTGVGMVQIISGINTYAKKPIAIITYNEIQAKQIIENLQNFTDKAIFFPNQDLRLFTWIYFTDKAIFFPKKEIVTYDYIAESKDLPYERIETLNQIVQKRLPIVVTTIEALMQKIPSKETLYKNRLELKIGKTYSLEEIKQKLVNLGYIRCDLIEGKGEFSVRGDILDISLDDKTGIRVEFWGDEVDSIRKFAIASQRSINTLDKIEINPAHEYILERQIEEIIGKIRNKVVKEKQEEILEEDIEQIKAGNYISKIDKYFDCFYKNQSTLLEYFSDNYIIAIDEESKIEQRAKNIIQDNINLSKSLIEKEKIVPEAIENIQKYDILQEKIENRKSLIYLEKQDILLKKQAEKYDFKYREVNYYKSEIENLFKDLKTSIKENKDIYILVSSKDKAKKLQETLEKEEIVAKIEENLDKTIIVKSKEKVITIGIGKLTEGFENYEINQLVISAEDLIEGKRRNFLN